MNLNSIGPSYINRKVKMTKEEMQEYREGLEAMTTDELIDIIIDQDQRLTIYEEKERKDLKQGKAL
jgi:hypothetical protein